MAERRMFTKQIIDSDAFLEMGSSAQSLYFHLGMRADDDGFVNNPKKIQRMVGSADDDLKILVAKRFVLMFESGVIVIKHWRMHNYIRGDRYHETVYKDEKSKLSVKENGSYTLNGNHLSTTCLPDDNQRLPQVRLGKVSIGKVSKDEDTDANAFGVFWDAYPRKTAKPNAEKAWKKLNPDAELLDTILKAIEKHKVCEQWTKDGGQFIPHPATWINGKRWEDEVVTGRTGKVLNFQNYNQGPQPDCSAETGIDLLAEARAMK